MEAGKHILNRIQLVTLIVSSLGIFLYLLFFVGKTYYDTYSLVIGIPIGILNYGIQDYAYIGARWDNLMITLLFTAILVFLVLYLFSAAFAQRSELYLQNQVRIKPKWGDIVVGIVYLVLFAFGLAYTGWVIFVKPTAVHELGFIFAGIVGGLGSAIWSLLMLIKNDVMLNWIKGVAFVKWGFIAVVIVILIFFPYVSAKAWGAFVGTMIPRECAIVELQAPYPLIDDVEWKTSADSSSVTSENLLMILGDTNYLVLKSENQTGSIYVIKRQDLQCVKIVGYVSDNIAKSVK